MFTSVSTLSYAKRGDKFYVGTLVSYQTFNTKINETITTENKYSTGATNKDYEYDNENIKYTGAGTGIFLAYNFDRYLVHFNYLASLDLASSETKKSSIFDIDKISLSRIVLGVKYNSSPEFNGFYFGGNLTFASLVGTSKSGKKSTLLTNQYAVVINPGYQVLFGRNWVMFFDILITALEHSQNNKKIVNSSPQQTITKVTTERLVKTSPIDVSVSIAYMF
ncbi:MAG: DUF3575 domain-containing protein [SAR324 cluster bacterium]|nr:DUF3575 domain-containing protein [SAR324 cluster bacterium]